MTPAEWRRRCEDALRALEAEPRHPWRSRLALLAQAIARIARSDGFVTATTVALLVAWMAALALRVDWANPAEMRPTMRGAGLGVGAILLMLMARGMLTRMRTPWYLRPVRNGAPRMSHLIHAALRGRDLDWATRHAAAKFESESPPPDARMHRLASMAIHLGNMRTASETYPEFGIDIARCEQSVRELAEAVGVDPEPIIRNSSGSIDRSIDRA